MTNEHWPHAEAPDFGGLNGRFGALLAAYNTLPESRALAAAQIVLGALSGVAAALWMVP